MSEQLKRLEEDYRKAFEEMMDFRTEVKKKNDDRKVLKFSHFLNKDRSPEDKAKFDEAKAEQEKMREKYKDERQADAVKYARLKAKADTLKDQYEKLKAEEEKQEDEELSSEWQKKPIEDRLVDNGEKMSKRTWMKPLAVVCCIVIAVVGVALLAKGAQDNEKDDGLPDSKGSSTTTDNKILTPEQANAYVGRTLNEFCAKFGDYANVHVFAFITGHGGSGVSCEEVGKGHYFDNFIITQVYYDEEYLNSDAYREFQRYCEDTQPKPSSCDRPLQVYVDSLPENEAREAGITIK